MVCFAVKLDDVDDLPALSCFTGAADSQQRYPCSALSFAPILFRFRCIFKDLNVAVNKEYVRKSRRLNRNCNL